MEQELRDKVLSAVTDYYNYINNNPVQKNYIPVSGKCIGLEELQNMVDASLDLWLTTGRFNDKFETDFAKYLEVKHALTTNSGSSANLLALSALTSYKLGDRQLKPGDEVITVAAGFPTTVNPIVFLGLVPVFVDCKIETCNIDVEDIEKSITSKTKAIMLAHTMGNMFDILRIKELCNKYNLWLIEDSCDALGAEFNGHKSGTIGDIGTFSFYPAHHITMGEGGAVVTNNSILYRILKSFRDWGRDCWCNPGHDDTCHNRFNQQFGKLPFGYDHKYVYSHLGYNLKITDWQAAIGCAQLKKVDEFIAKRRENFKLLYEKLSDLKEYIILPETEKECNPSWFGFLISVKHEDKKQKLVEFLESNGIGTRQLFAGNLLRQPSFVENHIPLRINGSSLLYSDQLTDENYKLLPNTDYIMNNTFWVGIYPALGEKEISKISNKIHDFFLMQIS